MNISQKGVELIKKFEGFSDKPYRCPAGKLTIGYGHVIQPERERFRSPITEVDAERILHNDLSVAEGTIRKSVGVPLIQGQYDALVSLVFNWGGINFLRSQGLKYLNSSDYRLAAEEFFSEEKGIVKVHGTVLPGLVKRRQAEWDLWNDKA